MKILRLGPDAVFDSASSGTFKNKFWNHLIFQFLSSWWKFRSKIKVFMKILKFFNLIQDHLEMIPRPSEHEKTWFWMVWNLPELSKILKDWKILKNQKLVKKMKSSEETTAESNTLSISKMISTSLIATYRSSKGSQNYFAGFDKW